MAVTSKRSIGARLDDRDLRERLARVRVLIADRDTRVGSLVQRILFSFGLRTIELVTNGEAALDALRTKPFDFLVTEWDMHPFSGTDLVRAIRRAREDHRIRRDIPILMLTARSELDHVEEARDAGITEFVAKPFSAATISSRIIQIIDNPRSFVESPFYTGPCRRRRGVPPPGTEDRRLPRGQKPPAVAAQESIAPPDFSLREQLGDVSAQEVLNPKIIAQAQETLMEAKSEYLTWAQTEILTLKRAFAALEQAPQDTAIHERLRAASYAIQSQAGIFNYPLGTEIARQLTHYLARHLPPEPNHLVVIGKHIDAVSVTFNQDIEQHGQATARELIASLKRLVDKLE